MPGEADPEIGVLGHVELIPPADVAPHLRTNVIAGAAQGNHALEAFDRGQHHPEPLVVFEGEPSGQQVLALVEVAEAALQAADVLRRALERHHRPTQLQRVRNVLGVIDGHVLAAEVRQRHSVVAGFRLGLGLAVRDDHHPHTLHRCADQGLLGCRVVFLDEQEQLESLRRVVDPAHAVDQVRHDRGFVVDRQQHRVVGQFVVGDRERFGVADLDQ